MVFPFVWTKYKWKFERDGCKLSFRRPLAASPLARAFFARLASLAQIGELARRLSWVLQCVFCGKTYGRGLRNLDDQVLRSNNNNNDNFISIALLSYVQCALQSYHVNNIVDKYLQIYNHILLYLQWVKKEKIKTKATIKPFYS